MFDSVHYYRLTSRCLCLKLEVPIIWKFLSHKVGIIQIQIISISNVKELNAVRRTSEWVKDNPQACRGHCPYAQISDQTHCESSELTANWEEPMFFLCLQTSTGTTVRPCVVCFIRDGILLLSPTLSCIGCLSLSTKAPARYWDWIVLHFCCTWGFLLAPQSQDSESGNTLITGKSIL